ncbi:hypothetical protein NLI96_g13307 [Meripilus lineatus]|uniref:Uncharacterized protein n=1 Tax=Meripilus lineatus TaxID=2056292 RepID=A0AAD5UPP2_9APHY|nr:hypothetical protein NLI96_g13307 [Physisporinus lineatus]
MGPERTPAPNSHQRSSNHSLVGGPPPQQVDALPWSYHMYYGIGHHPGHCPICDRFFTHMDGDAESHSFQAAIAKRENHFNTRVEVARTNEASATAEVNRLRQVILTMEAEMREIARERDVGRERNLLLQQQVRILERDPAAMVVDPRDPPQITQPHTDLENLARDYPHFRGDISSDDPYYEPEMLLEQSYELSDEPWKLLKDENVVLKPDGSSESSAGNARKSSLAQGNESPNTSEGQDHYRSPSGNVPGTRTP